MSKASRAVDGVSAPRSRRRWTKPEKRRIVEEALTPGASIARVARAHDVNTNQLHSWRRLYERGLLDGIGERATLLPVRVIQSDGASLPVVRLGSTAATTGPAPKAGRRRALGVIQIEVQRGRLRIEGSADPMTLRVVLESLLG